ncbi:DnaJ domain-containing protein [Bernardetia sp. MNP-M8]|uniref:tetratricopeptide repeat protein n=1 Tax=Bernardetia sp. MNP-M8 TaxID=3127470 RepID=UPI0030D3B9A8
MSNYYDLLGITKTATLQEIKSAYKKQALKFHPDRNAATPQEAQLAEERFKLINEAYQVLSDPIKKSRYDNELEFESARRQQYYKQYTSSGNYSDSSNQNTHQNTQRDTGYTYQRRQTTQKKQPTFEFGKTELYIVLGFAVMFVFAYLLMNVMTNYSYNTYIEEAKAAIESNDFVTAHKALEEAQTQKEEDAEVNYLLGKIQLNRKNYADAISYFRNALSYTDKGEKEIRAKYHNEIADTYFLMNEYYLAIEEYKIVGSLGGYNQRVLMNIADLYLEKLRDYDKASLYFDKIIEKEPKLVEPYIGKAVAKHNTKDYQAMGELLDKAIEINPKNSYLWYYKGFYFWEKPVSGIESEIENNGDAKVKDKQNACESWKIAVSYGSQEAAKPLSEYCK